MAASLTVAGTELAPITLYDVTIDAGRDDIESQPDGSVLNATLAGLAPAAIGDPIQLTDPGGLLFHGWITDLTAELNPDDMTWTVKLTATGPLAILGHMLAGQVTYPEETDSARIYRILEEAGALHAVDPDIIGPYILAREAETEWAATLARSTADDGMGVLWEQPADTAAPIRYLPERFRHWTLHKLTWSELPRVTWDGLGEPTGQLLPGEYATASTAVNVATDSTVRPVTVSHERAAHGDTSHKVITGGANDIYFSLAGIVLQPGEYTYMVSVYSGTAVRVKVYDINVPGAAGAVPVWDVPPGVWTEIRSVITIPPGHIKPVMPCGYNTPNPPADTVVYYDKWGVFAGTDAVWQMPYVTWNDFNSDTIGQAPEAPGDLEVDPATTLAEATFTQQIDDLVRTATVTYGPEPEEGDRATVTVGDQVPAADYDTQLANQGDAAHYADNMLRRYQQPAWRLDHIRIPLHTLPPAEQATIRAALEVGTRLTVPFPLGSPVGYVWQGFLEGWRHELLGDISGEFHYLELHTSERSLTESSDRWMDINPTITWDNTAPDMTWLDAVQWRAA